MLTRSAIPFFGRSKPRSSRPSARAVGSGNSASTATSNRKRFMGTRTTALNSRAVEAIAGPRVWRVPTNMQTRRKFLRTVSLAGSSAVLLPEAFGAEVKPGSVSFFLVGDTHYRANLEGTPQMDLTSREYNARLVQW